MRFPYHTEPLRPAAILLAVVGVVALLAPNANWRLLILVWISGPLAWSAMQWLRRGCGVMLHDDVLSLQSGITHRIVIVPLPAIQAYRLTADDRLALAYLQPRRAEPDEEPRPPRLRLYVSAPLADPGGLVAALPTVNSLTPAQLASILGWRRVRRALWVIFGVLIGVPTLIILGARLINGVLGLLR